MVDAIQRHRTYLETSGEGVRRERRRLAGELESCLRELALVHLRQELPDGRLEAALADLIGRRQTPRQAAERLLAATPK